MGRIKWSASCLRMLRQENNGRIGKDILDRFSLGTGGKRVCKMTVKAGMTGAGDEPLPEIIMMGRL